MAYLLVYYNKKVSAVVAILMGGQPKCMQTNIDKSICLICDTRTPDTALYILFECDALSDVRNRKLKACNKRSVSQYIFTEVLRTVCSQEMKNI